jgi:hypothetical protein
MNPRHVPTATVACLTAAVLMAVFVAGGLLAVFTYAIALELWIRFLTSEPQPIPVRRDEDGNR